MKQASINKFFGGKPPKAEDAPAKASPAKKAAAAAKDGQPARQLKRLKKAPAEPVRA
jgi:hypothetical protein